jgi:hypothetical protein
VNQYPAGTILRHEKDALLLDRQMHTQERGGEKRDIITSALDAKKSLFDSMDLSKSSWL